jgi:hypothetical protein
MSVVESPPKLDVKKLFVPLAVTLWAIALFVISVRVALRPNTGTVYNLFADAGRNWVQGKNLYLKSGFGYRYAPSVAVAFAPLTIVPDWVGGILWRLINAAVFVAGIWSCWNARIPPLARRLVSQEQRDWTDPQLLAILFLLVLPALTANINNGQANPLVIGALMLSAAAVVRERWTGAAVWATVATLLKIYPIAFAILVVLLYPKRFGWRLILVLAVGLLLPFAFQRPGYVMSQYRIWNDYVWHETRSASWYYDVRRPLKIWFDINTTGKVYSVLQLAGGVAIAAISLLAQRVMRAPPAQVLTLALSLVSCWMMFLGPATESPTYLLVAPALAWAVMQAWDEPVPATPSRKPVSRIATTVCYVLMLTMHLSIWFSNSSSYRMYGNPGFVSSLILTGCVIGLFVSNAQSAKSIAAEPSR